MDQEQQRQSRQRIVEVFSASSESRNSISSVEQKGENAQEQREPLVDLPPVPNASHINDGSKIELRMAAIDKLKKDDMTLGQFWQYSRGKPSDQDGYVIEQKINRCIAENFQRLQSKVDIAFNGQTQAYDKFRELDERIEVMRGQMGRINKYDMLFEDLTRQLFMMQSSVTNISIAGNDAEARSRSSLDIFNKRCLRIETELQHFEKKIKPLQNPSQDFIKQIHHTEEAVMQRLWETKEGLEEKLINVEGECMSLKLKQSELGSRLDSKLAPLRQYDIAFKKFETRFVQYEECMKELTLHIEALKINARLHKQHMEAFLPFQTLSLIYDNVSMLARHKYKRILRNTFSKQLEKLQHNLIAVCNPNKPDDFACDFSLCNYNLPEVYLYPSLLDNDQVKKPAQNLTSDQKINDWYIRNKPDQQKQDDQATRQQKKKQHHFKKEAEKKQALVSTNKNYISIALGSLSYAALRQAMNAPVVGLREGQASFTELLKLSSHALHPESVIKKHEVWEKNFQGDQQMLVRFELEMTQIQRQINYELLRESTMLEERFHKQMQTLTGDSRKAEVRHTTMMTRIEQEKQNMHKQLVSSVEHVNKFSNKMTELESTIRDQASMRQQYDDMKIQLIEILDDRLKKVEYKSVVNARALKNSSKGLSNVIGLSQNDNQSNAGKSNNDSDKLSPETRRRNQLRDLTEVVSSTDNKKRLSNLIKKVSRTDAESDQTQLEDEISSSGTESESDSFEGSAISSGSQSPNKSSRNKDDQLVKRKKTTRRESSESANSQQFKLPPMAVEKSQLETLQDEGTPLINSPESTIKKVKRLLHKASEDELKISDTTGSVYTCKDILVEDLSLNAVPCASQSKFNKTEKNECSKILPAEGSSADPLECSEAVRLADPDQTIPADSTSQNLKDIDYLKIEPKKSSKAVSINQISRKKSSAVKEKISSQSLISISNSTVQSKPSQQSLNQVSSLQSSVSSSSSSNTSSSPEKPVENKKKDKGQSKVTAHLKQQEESTIKIAENPVTSSIIQRRANYKKIRLASTIPEELSLESMVTAKDEKCKQSNRSDSYQVDIGDSSISKSDKKNQLQNIAVESLETPAPPICTSLDQSQKNAPSPREQKNHFGFQEGNQKETLASPLKKRENTLKRKLTIAERSVEQPQQTPPTILDSICQELKKAKPQSGEKQPRPKRSFSVAPLHIKQPYQLSKSNLSSYDQSITPALPSAKKKSGHQSPANNQIYGFKQGSQLQSFSSPDSLESSSSMSAVQQKKQIKANKSRFRPAGMKIIQRGPAGLLRIMTRHLQTQKWFNSDRIKEEIFRAMQPSRKIENSLLADQDLAQKTKFNRKQSSRNMMKTDANARPVNDCSSPYTYKMTQGLNIAGTQISSPRPIEDSYQQKPSLNNRVKMSRRDSMVSRQSNVSRTKQLTKRLSVLSKKQGGLDRSGTLISSYSDYQESLEEEYPSIVEIDAVQNETFDAYKTELYQKFSLHLEMIKGVEKNIQKIEKRSEAIVEQQVSKLIPGLEEKVEVRIASASQKFNEHVIETVADIENQVKKWRKRHTQFETNQDKLIDQMEKCKEQCKALQEQVLITSQALFDSQQINQQRFDLACRLLKSDDNDKQTVSLIGIDKQRPRNDHLAMRQGAQQVLSPPLENKKPDASAIILDPKCLNCTKGLPGHEDFLMKQFKIACLSYRSQPVELQSGQSYSRSEVIDMIRILAEKLERQIQDTISQEQTLGLPNLWSANQAPIKRVNLQETAKEETAKEETAKEETDVVATKPNVNKFSQFYNERLAAEKSNIAELQKTPKPTVSIRANRIQITNTVDGNSNLQSVNAIGNAHVRMGDMRSDSSGERASYSRNATTRVRSSDQKQFGQQRNSSESTQLPPLRLSSEEFSRTDFSKLKSDVAIKIKEGIGRTQLQDRSMRTLDSEVLLRNEIIQAKIEQQSLGRNQAAPGYAMGARTIDQHLLQLRNPLSSSNPALSARLPQAQSTPRTLVPLKK